ncbi:STAS domain-containing protein [Glaciimonas immobilis]|uniref:ABC-type transporter Mla MlaB component n=1 Tax=Glaciimonas immobilis TaxID=728004 RepID=A0A840S1F1_9BURK|nr:STAS domain-containing protein [Glaciimonas immobilis]KAF3997301.1 hypothetical protein HAV38_14075 [Glaciimonas immobilis]MBB5202399.1 ABC-type transporter Mla MlaB component [Glaciimonas immobilis]
MGIFSIFGKTARKSTDTISGTNTAIAKRAALTEPGNSAHNEEGTQTRQGNVAPNSTAMKIDAIESEMSSEFVYPSTIAATGAIDAAGRSTTFQGNDPRITALTPTKDVSAPDQRGSTIQVLTSDTPAVIEEAALLFANAQSDIAEQLLEQAIQEDNLGSATTEVWWMLLDLYRINGKQQQFDDLSLSFVHKFESSPPTWDEQLTLNPNTDMSDSAATPAVSFAGKLDANITRQLQRALKFSQSHSALRLEFTRIKSVDPIGCGLLLRTLKKLQESKLELILAGTTELTNGIRAILCVGRRDETTAPWLLLLEILHLLNQEQAFEDVSIDYCITFEVSPPSFFAPATKVTTAAPDRMDGSQSGKEREHFMMPALVEGRVDDLLLQIQGYTSEHNPTLLNCSRLIRVDFNAAGQLMNTLLPLVGQGRQIEFHELNHLVVALFRVMGMQDTITINARKN